MKLSQSLLLLAGVQAAAVEKCPAIETVAGQIEGADGIECDETRCRRVCQPGYTAVKPRIAECTKVSSGVFEWSKQIGGCVTCNIPNFSGSVNTNCKINGKNQSICNVTCPAGGLFNGKEGKTGTKLTCFCSKKTGNCKWKNSNNKKVTFEKIESYFCSGVDDTGNEL